MTTAAVLTAAGSGTRLGRRMPKALVELDGVPLVLRAAQGLAAAGCVGSVVVTVPDGAVARFTALFPDGAVPGTGVPVTVVAGGATRQASVDAGLAALPPDADVVLVHDAARCLTPPETVRAVEAAVRSGHRAVVPALPVTDTVKAVGPADVAGAEPVTATVDRAVLRAVQTPQGFDRDVLVAAHRAGAARAADEAVAASDDAGLVEALGELVWVVPGHELAMKITTPRDLALAEMLVAEAARAEPAEAAALPPTEPAERGRVTF